jgi:hypothetical protein
VPTVASVEEFLHAAGTVIGRGPVLQTTRCR